MLGRLPEVKTVVTRIGSPELATDVMGIDLADVFAMLKPRSEWTVGSKAELIEKMEELLAADAPGVGFSFTQPIEMRFNELIAGVRSDVAVKLFGDDLDVLASKGEEIARVVGAVPGAADVKLEQTTGLPMLRVRPDRDRCARYGISVGDVLDTVEAVRAGKVVGTVFEGQRRFSLAVRFDDRTSSSWIPGYSFTIPPTQLIHVDIDPEEIGRNYPVALGLMADVRTFLSLSDESPQAVRNNLEGAFDPEEIFFVGTQAARLQMPEATAILGRAVDAGYAAWDALERHPWIAPVRNQPGFAEVRERAARARERAYAAFRDAGGPSLLGLPG